LSTVDTVGGEKIKHTLEMKLFDIDMLEKQNENQN